MEYKDITEYLPEFIKCWNHEFGTHLPMHEELVHQCTVGSKHIVNKATKALVIDHQFVGLIVTKTYKGDIPIDSYQQMGFISLLFVRKEERNKRYGSKLLSLALSELKRLEIKTVLLGTDVNPFFPGVPEYCIDSKPFFEHHGFIQKGRAFNLLMNQNPHFCFDSTYDQRGATLLDREQLLTFIKSEFSQRWYYEADTYFQNGGTGREFVILLDQGKMIGFARINDQESKQIMHNINWSRRYHKLGGIGPLGVAKAYRGKKLGTRITNFGTQVLFNRGCSDVLVDWTGLSAFYEKSGFKLCDLFYSFELKL